MSRCAMMLACVAGLAVGVEGFMDELPLKVLAVTPDGDAPMLRGRDAITVTFSRAVIALGADFGPGEMPADLTPFTLSGAGAAVPGRLRWVTTFSARFDPTDEWPTDLEFDVQINPSLTSFDRASLVADENTAPKHLTTAPVSVSMGSVTSQQAAALTDGAWVDSISEMPPSSEMPPDGILTLRFSHPVDPAMVSASLQLRDANGNPQRGPSIVASACESRWSGDRCVAVTVQGELALDTRYQVTLPAGSNYHPLCGPTGVDTIFSISGLVPFRFPFLQGLQIPENQYQQTRPTYRRWDMWVRHGLAPSTTAAVLQAAISISPKATFTVTIKDSSTIRLEGDFEPATTYTITVQDSASCLDGFNLPLTGSASMMMTADRPEFFITPGTNDYRSQDGAIFNSHGGAPDQWTALSQGTTRCLASYQDLRNGNCDGHDPMYVDAFSVSNTPQSITGAIASLYNNQASFPAEAGVATAGPVSSPMTETVQEIGFPTAGLLADTGLFVVNRWDGMSYQGTATGESELVSTTNIGVTFVASAQQELIAWATRLDTNADAAGVSIAIYNVERSYQCTPDQVSLVTTATTGRDGLVSIDLSTMTSRYPTLVAVINNKGKLSIVRNLPRFNTYNNNGNADARLVTDRGLYKVGDTVSVKGFVRDHSGAELDIPTGTFELQTQWKNRGQPDATPVTVDATLGTFSAQLTVPADADYQDTRISLQWTPPADAASHYGRQIGNAQITIADPRPPTVKLTLDTRDGNTVMAADGQIALTVDTMTYTGSPVGSASVDLTWSLSPNYGGGNGVNALLGSEQGVQATDDDFPTSGTLSVVSGDDGHGALAFSIDGLAEKTAQFQDGSTVQISASWTGPTREVVTDDLTVTISSSPWKVDMQTTPSNPVPGYTFATTIALRDVVDQTSIDGHETTVQLYAWPEGSTATLGADGAPVMPGPALQSCTMQSDGGVNPGCPMTLPGVGKFALVACAQDNSRKKVCSASLLGKTQSEWATSPLTSFQSAFSLVPNQQTFAMGDTAVFSFFNPFASGCRAFVRWGNKAAKQQMTTAALDTGAQSIQIPVGEECRGGCRVMIVLTAPAQSDSLTLPVPLPVSPLFDIGEATVVETHHTLSVPNHDHELNVAVTVDDDVAAPGSTTGFTVTVTDSSGRPVAGEVAVFGVDQAFLDLKPHPSVDVASAFALNMVDNSQFQCHSSLEALASTDGYASVAGRVQSLVEQEPWATVSSWPLRPSGSGIEGDLQQYVETMSSFITDQGCTYCNRGPVYGYGGAAVNGMAEDSFMDSAEAAPPMAMAGGGASFGGMAPPAPPPAPMAAPMAPGAMSANRGMVAGGGAAPASADIPVRSAFATAPLFAPTLAVPASGSVHVPFPLPDNVGTFNLRAYAVTARSQFGVGETQQIVRNPLSLVASAPRIVRVGDDFACGFTLTTADSSFRGNVQVTATVNRGGLSLAQGAGSQTVRMTGAGPQEVVFSFSAAALEEAELQFSASASVGRDSFTVTLPVLGAQDGVCIATSMAIDGSAAGTPWPEGIVLPDAVPGSGDLVLSAGVGYLPTVQSLAHSLLNLPETLNGNSLVNSLAPAAMLSPYSSGNTDDLLSASVSQVATSFTELAKFTDEDGLRYSLHKPSYNGLSYINTRLNAWASYVAQRLSDSGVAGVDADTRAQWRTAVVTGLTREAQMAESRGYAFSNFETLALARLVLGTGDDWMAEAAVSTTVSSWLSMESLVAHADSCSDFCKAATALTLLNADASSAQAAAILQPMIARMRVTGRTGYISIGHNGHATGMAANALFLSAAASAMGRQQLAGFSTLTLQKLANYIAQGSADQRWGGVFATATDVHRGFALSDYDSFTHSNEPNVHLTVSSGDAELLTGSFTPGHTDDISSATAWEDLASPPAPLAFMATGSGELSVAAAMTFIPSQMYASPVYRGLYVEKIIQTIDPQTGLPTGAPLQAVRLGQMVAVTIQVTTADDVQDLVLEDWTAGGLEPVDPNIDADALNAGSNCGGLYHPAMSGAAMGGGRPMMGGGPVMGGGPMMGGMRPPAPPSRGGASGGSFDSGAYWYFFSCTSFERQTRPDRVSYYSRFARAGTHSMTYQAMAATSGQFVLPPTKASLAAQPEVMGLSAGGSFAVSRTPLTPAQQFLPVPGGQTPMDCPTTCPNDCDVTTGHCNPTVSLITTATDAAGGGGKSGHRRQMTSSYIL